MDMFTQENFKWEEDSITRQTLGEYIPVVPLNAGNNASKNLKKKPIKLHVKSFFVSSAQIRKLCNCTPDINTRGYS